MQTLHHISALRSAASDWRAHADSIAFVPTMGNLHEGHLRLVEQARARARRVVVSIFVNPLQFGPHEDYLSYPRTLAEDSLQLAERNVDILFAPDERELYPSGVHGLTRVEVPELSQVLCGAHRPGHFTGVTTVVNMLLNIVHPDVALFGEKDYQQLLIIRRMVADLHMAVDIVGVATVRDPDGLAMSSRNQYLSPEQRRRAPRLYEALRQAAAMLQENPGSRTAVERRGLAQLEAAGFRPEYFAVRDAATLTPPSRQTAALVVLAAAWLGGARLIDNIVVQSEAHE